MTPRLSQGGVIYSLNAYNLNILARGQPLEPRGAQLRALKQKRYTGLGVEIIISTKTCPHTLRAARKGSRILQAPRAPRQLFRFAGSSGSGVPEASGTSGPGASGSGHPEVSTCFPGMGYISGSAGSEASGSGLPELSL